mmetsp:Transcript_11340/g.23800  ORF Transcript_11340/g.23800 Transcript_11340/m.23800 type:complete len:210 (-) Transcript_11340:773-1402(-)
MAPLPAPVPLLAAERRCHPCRDPVGATRCDDPAGAARRCHGSVPAWQQRQCLHQQRRMAWARDCWAPAWPRLPKKHRSRHRSGDGGCLQGCLGDWMLQWQRLPDRCQQEPPWPTAEPPLLWPRPQPGERPHELGWPRPASETGSTQHTPGPPAAKCKAAQLWDEHPGDPRRVRAPLPKPLRPRRCRPQPPVHVQERRGSGGAHSQSAPA